MRKAGILLFVFLALVGFSSVCFATPEWLPFQENRNTFEPNDIRILSNTWSEKNISINIPGVVVEEVQTKGGIFTKISFVDESYAGAFGTPQLPVIRRIIEVPFGTEIKVEISNVQRKIINLNDRGNTFLLHPAQPPIPKLQGATERAVFVFNQESYNVDAIVDIPVVRVLNEGILRGHRLACLEIRPVEYNPVQNSIYYMDKIDFKLLFPTSDISKTRSSIEEHFSPEFQSLIGSIALQGTEIRDFSVPSSRVNPCYLVICADSLKSELTSWTDWKAAKYEVKVVPTSTAGSTTSAIKTYLQNAYKWANKPVFVLLVGDTDTIPTFTSGGSADDMLYADLDGGGYWTPDVYLGRWPARTVDQLKNIIAKTLQFDKMTMPDKNYFKDSVWLASSDHSSMVEGTHQYCFDNYIKPEDSNNNKMHQVFERLGGNTAGFASNVNEGRGFVCYSGHGYGDGTGTASVHFVGSDVKALKNINEYPHVMVYACGTNLFDQTASFGELWLTEKDKGSVTYWGTSDSSYWDEDDLLQRTAFLSRFNDKNIPIAKAHFLGLIKVHENFSSSSEYYFRIYNLMGDPSLIWPARIP